MTTRRTACSCGQLHLTIEGEPSRISMCHCLACQRRTGAVISNQARFRREQITIAGRATAWTRMAESGHTLTFHFCPTCGSTVSLLPSAISLTRNSLRRPSRCGRNHVTLGYLCRPRRRPSACRSRDDKSNRRTSAKSRAIYCVNFGDQSALIIGGHGGESA
jgi:hypothetical protein